MSERTAAEQAVADSESALAEAIHALGEAVNRYICEDTDSTETLAPIDSFIVICADKSKREHTFACSPNATDDQLRHLLGEVAAGELERLERRIAADADDETNCRRI